jgi:hypothetical protein
VLGLAGGTAALGVTAPRAVGVRLRYEAVPAAVDVNLPTLNDFRVRESRRMLEAVARRSGR